MKNIFVIFKHNLKSIVKGWFWLVLILPIAINLFVNVLMNRIGETKDGGTYYSVAIYTESKDEIVDKLLPKEKFSKRIMVKSQKELKEVLDNEKSYVGIMFNSDNIYEDIKNNKDNVIEIIYNGKESNKEYVLSVLNSGITQISSLGNNKQEFLKLSNDFEQEKYSFNYETNKLEDILAYTLMFGLFTMGFLFIAGRCINPLLKERELKIDRRILASKISKVQYSLGHILGCFTLLLVQSIMLVSTFCLLNKSFDISFMWMMILSFAMSFVGIAVALMVLSVSNNSTIYYTLLSIIITPMALLSGAFVPLEFLPYTVQKFCMISPLTWINSAFKNILMNRSYEVIGLDLIVAISISLVMIMIYLVIENKKKIS